MSNWAKINSITAKFLFFSACLSLIREDVIFAGILMLLSGILKETQEYI
jgi:hypothetical protein